MGSSLIDPSFAWLLDTGYLNTRAEQPHSSLFYISFIWAPSTSLTSELREFIIRSIIRAACGHMLESWTSYHNLLWILRLNLKLAFNSCDEESFRGLIAAGCQTWSLTASVSCLEFILNWHLPSSVIKIESIYEQHVWDNNAHIWAIYMVERE